MSTYKKITAILAAMFAATILMTAHAADPVIEQAKAQGIIGEMYTGYLGFVEPGKASADLKRRVDEINAARLQAYTEIASQRSQTVQTVGQLMAEIQFERAQPGELVKPANEPWTKKQ